MWNKYNLACALYDTNLSLNTFNNHELGLQTYEKCHLEPL